VGLQKGKEGPLRECWQMLARAWVSGERVLFRRASLCPNFSVGRFDSSILPLSRNAPCSRPSTSFSACIREDRLVFYADNSVHHSSFNRALSRTSLPAVKDERSHANLPIARVSYRADISKRAASVRWLLHRGLDQFCVRRSLSYHAFITADLLFRVWNLDLVAHL
jgi:hypothetical protein